MKQFFVVQNIVARLLNLRAVQLKQLEPEAQGKLLQQCGCVVASACVVATTQLLGIWSPVIGWQPSSHIPIADEPSWAQVLSELASLNDRESWAVLEIEERVLSTNFQQHHYVLVPLLDAVHQHAENQVFTHA